MNNTMRFNITSPHELSLRLKASSNCSKLIAESLEDKFAREEEKLLEVALAEGYKERAQEDAKLNSEFDHMVEDGI